jgi:hypothetical protein
MNNILCKRSTGFGTAVTLALIDSVYADDFLAHRPQSSEIPERRGIADGRIAEQWCMFDDLARLRQLGVSAEHLHNVLMI